jgi:hypothetical protein
MSLCVKRKSSMTYKCTNRVKKIKLSGFDGELAMQGKGGDGWIRHLGVCIWARNYYTSHPLSLTQIATPSNSASDKGFKNRSHNLVRRYWLYGIVRPRTIQLRLRKAYGLLQHTFIGYCGLPARLVDISRHFRV